MAPGGLFHTIHPYLNQFYRWHDAVQAGGAAQVPRLQQVGLRRRGEAGGRLEVAHGLLQVQYVQKGNKPLHFDC